RLHLELRRKGRVSSGGFSGKPCREYQTLEWMNEYSSASCLPRVARPAGEQGFYHEPRVRDELVVARVENQSGPNGSVGEWGIRRILAEGAAARGCPELCVSNPCAR